MRRLWSQEDIEFLSDNAGLMNYKQLSKKLGRSANAIKLYRARHKTPRFFENFYSYTLLSKELGMSRKVIRKYHSRGWIKGRKADWTSAYGKKPMIFLEEHIVQFLKTYCYLFKDRFIPNIYFRNVVKDCMKGLENEAMR